MWLRILLLTLVLLVAGLGFRAGMAALDCDNAIECDDPSPGALF